MLATPTPEIVVVDYLVADVDAFVTDIHAGASDQFANVILRFTAK